MSNTPNLNARYLSVILFNTVLLCAALATPKIYAFEFTGERWREKISYHYMDGCPSFVLPAIEKAFNSVSPVDFDITGRRDSVGFDYKVTFYCADQPVRDLQVIPSTIAWHESKFALSENTIGATTRRYWIIDSQKIIDFDIWLNSSVIDLENIDKILNHEILHGLGIRHSDNPDALMYFLPKTKSMHADDLAAINLLYEICKDNVDEKYNLFMHNVPVDGENYYGILPVGGTWPDDVHTIGFSVCD
ncbi:MAG: matrixin family metalloprotease [Pseudohongiellaceae bacterium]